MKRILISIKPEWVAKILNGEKTVEIRKTAPKCELPIEVYIYCTQGKHLFAPNGFNEHWWVQKYFGGEGKYNEKVVAKFTLNEVEELYLEPYIYDSHSVTYKYGLYKGEWKDVMERCSCLNENQIDEYLGNGSRFYAWHISDLKIFDEPKELSEFYSPRLDKDVTKLFDNSIQLSNGKWVKRLDKAPQSWCYVEEKE